MAISLFGNLFLYQKWQDSKSELQLARLEKVQYTQELKRVQTNNTQLAQELSFITQPNNKLIRLSGSEIYPEAKVTVFWNPNDKKLYISVLDLPEPPKGKQYQLWAVHGEEVLDAGVFEIGDESQNLQAMLDIAEADQFIITLEKRGGVPVAEGEAYAFGEVS